MADTLAMYAMSSSASGVQWMKETGGVKVISKRLVGRVKKV